MNLLCTYLLPILSFVLQIPYNLLSGLGLGSFGAIFQQLYATIAGLMGCSL